MWSIVVNYSHNKSNLYQFLTKFKWSPHIEDLEGGKKITYIFKKKKTVSHPLLSSMISIFQKKKDVTNEKVGENTKSDNTQKPSNIG